MDQKFQELYNSYLKSSKDDVAEFAKQRFLTIIRKRKESGETDKDAFDDAVIIMATFVVMDDKLSNEEWALFEYIMQSDIPREEVVRACKDGTDNNNIKIIKRWCDNDSEFKNAVIQLGLCVCAIDGNISPDEHELIKYYLSK